MKIGNGRGRYRWSCRRESLVDFEWTKRIDKIYIWNTGNARESVKFIVGEGRFLKKMKFEGWQTQIWDRNRGTNCNSYFVGESQIAEVHLRFHYRSFVKRNWLCVVRASSKVIGIRKRRKALLLCSRFIIEIKSIVRLSNKENRNIVDRSISSFFLPSSSSSFACSSSKTRFERFLAHNHNHPPFQWICLIDPVYQSNPTSGSHDTHRSYLPLEHPECVEWRANFSAYFSNARWTSFSNDRFSLRDITYNGQTAVPTLMKTPTPISNASHER